MAEFASWQNVIINLYADIISRSYYVTYKKDIRKLSAKENLEQSLDPSSDFREWQKN